MQNPRMRNNSTHLSAVSSDLRDTYAAYPNAARDALLAVRQIIFDVAASNPSVGNIQETLKWGQPAYLTPASKSGSTIRLAWLAAQPDMCGIYLNCNTTLISRMRDVYPDAFFYEGKRAALFPAKAPPHRDVLSHCIEMALTYHSSKTTKVSP